ncbi:MAG: threonine ammonia-lyase, partial [Oscillospiraceae bacterium]
VVTVSEKEIAIAMLTLLERHKVVSEGAGAMPSAAIMSGKVDATKYKNIVCMVSGGNVDTGVLTKILNRALVYSGRITEISTTLVDKPGNLSKLLDLVSSQGANVLEINHLRETEDVAVAIGSCIVKLVVETRDAEHKAEVYKALAANGYKQI